VAVVVVVVVAGVLAALSAVLSAGLEAAWALSRGLLATAFLTDFLGRTSTTVLWKLCVE
jgi:hypothetical protein